MSEIEHPNVLRALEFGETEFIDANDNKEMKKFIVTEIAEGGELLDWISIGGKFEEPLARFYFK